MRSPLIAIGLALCASTAQAQQARPNFLFILTDDVAQRHMPHARQTLRDLGEHGVTFERAYTDRPLCTPSRTTFFTGRYAASHGVRGQGTATRAAGPAPNAISGSPMPSRSKQPATPPRSSATSPSPGPASRTARRSARRAGTASSGRRGAQAPSTTTARPGPTAALRPTPSSGSPRRRLSPPAPGRGRCRSAPMTPTHPYTPPPRYANALPSLTYPRDPAFNVPGIAYPPFLALQVAGTAAVRDTDTRFRGSTRELLVIDDAVAEMVSWLGQRGQLANTYFILSSDNGYHFLDHAIEPREDPAHRGRHQRPATDPRPRRARGRARATPRDHGRRRTHDPRRRRHSHPGPHGRALAPAALARPEHRVAQRRPLHPLGKHPAPVTACAPSATPTSRPTPGRRSS